MSKPTIIMLAMMLVLRCAEAQVAGTELTMRTFDSVDVEVCADSIMATDQQALQAEVVAQLQALLGTTAVYLTRLYTRPASGTICFMYVYQARSPTEAREAVQTLLADTATLPVTFKGYMLRCRISAVPWVGEDAGPLGLNWQLTGSDVLLWGGLAGGLLVACSVSVCCFVQLSQSRESKRAALLLAKDRKIMKMLMSVHQHDSEEASPVKNKEAAGSAVKPQGRGKDKV
jgi:hypothetical protein